MTRVSDMRGQAAGPACVRCFRSDPCDACARREDTPTDIGIVLTGLSMPAKRVEYEHASLYVGTDGSFYYAFGHTAA